MSKTTSEALHRHKDSRKLWTTLTEAHAHDFTETAHPADVLTADQVSKLLLVLAGSGGGTTPPTPPADTTPPVISGIAVTSITQTSVAVSWTINEPSTGQVEYGLTSAYGSSTALESSLLTSHSQTITGLTAGTTYHYRVKSADAATNLTTTADRTFATAATPPPDPGGAYPPDTTLTYVAVNAQARPGYLQEITDATWGTKVRRITDVHMRRNAYPKQMSWNKDGSRIFLGYGFRFLDAAYNDLGQHATGVEYPVWSNVNADWMYGCSDGQNVLRRFSVASNIWTTRHVFAGYGHISLGDYEGNISADDTRIALTYNTLANQTGTWGVVIYDPVADAVISSLAIGTGSASHPNNCNISRSGAYVMVQHGASGSGANQGTRLYNAADMSHIRLITADRAHGDMARDASGADIYVHMSDGLCRSHKCSDGTNLTLLDSPNSLIGHVSGQAIDRLGWVYVSSTVVSTNPGFDQIVAVKTDGSKTVEVFGSAHTAHAGATYESSPFAVPNRDGTKVMWGGDWNGNPATQIYCFVAAQGGT